jgi:hypothetical protein
MARAYITFVATLVAFVAGEQVPVIAPAAAMLKPHLFTAVLSAHSCVPAVCPLLRALLQPQQLLHPAARHPGC